MLKGWLGFFSGKLFVLLLMAAGVHCEYFSSVDSLAMLSSVEKELIDAAREYVVAQRREFEKYKSFVARIEDQHDEAIEDLDDYLGNPLNAYTLIKRLVIDWEHLHQEVMENRPREAFRAKLDKMNEEYGLPDKSDLSGAIKGLARLQEVYSIPASVLSKGDIEGFYYGSELEWYDCYEIGVQLFEARQYSRAISWFDEALPLLENFDKTDIFDVGKNHTEFDIYEYLALAHHEVGNTNQALSYIGGILSQAPEHKAQQVRTYIEMAEPLKGDEFNWNPPNWHANYTSLCRGTLLPEPSTTKRQRPNSCYLDSTAHAYFTLAPLKVEPTSFDPQITMYHALLNDNQIEAILKEADELEMQRSAVVGSGKSIVRDLRVSQQTWMEYKSPVMSTVRLLTQLIGNFDMKNSELMQMANYGIGGLYEPHHDYFRTNLPKHFEGDRIATNMFYLSDVELGGYTVFPKINAFLSPVKGALVMWYNLHRSLDVDVRTLHAGCPVIKGSKRIGNIWVHSGLQEFRRPCGLQSDAFKSNAYK